MDLLFQKTSAGNTELKKQLGFIDADLKITNLLPDIKTATKDVISLIGKEVYAIAVTQYNNGTIDPEDLDFVTAVQYPIAIQAYRLYSPSNDLAHTNNGRKMLQDDGQKLPFEWMLNRDNASLEKRYYRALDDLLIFLDEIPAGALKTAWVESTAFKASHNLFVRTVADFDTAFPMDSRLLLIKLAPGMAECEELEIQARLTATKFNDLKTKLKNNTEITETLDKVLISLIKKACVSYAIAWALPRMSVNIFPEGVLQSVTDTSATTQGKIPSKKSEVEAARQAFALDTQSALTKIENILAPAQLPDETIVVTPTIITGTGFFSA